MTSEGSLIVGANYSGFKPCLLNFRVITTEAFGITLDFYSVTPATEPDDAEDETTGDQ